jgi:hypothetical protein
MQPKRDILIKKMEALQGRKTREGSEVDNQSRWYRSEVIHQVGW